MATAIHGRSGHVTIGAGPTVVGSVTAWSYKESVDDTESTAMGDTGKTYLGGLRDGTLELECWWNALADTGQDAVLDAVQGGTPVAVAVFPNGTGTGKPKYSGNVTFTAVDASGSKDSICTLKATARGFLTLAASP